MRKSVFLSLLSCIAFQANSQSVRLSKDAEISLLTCGPGREIYSYFGHSALLVTDRANGINRVYNYGTFDFSVPNFYGQFIQGKMYYMLSVSRFEGFMNEYISENRYIRELPLLIPAVEKQQLFELLEFNYRPENRHYWYDFFLDNCTTRIRDILLKATDSVYRWPDISNNDLSFRELIKPYLKNHPWERTGILLLLAAGADRTASREEYLFLPERMHTGFAGAETRDGRRLTGIEKQVFTPVNDAEKGSRLFHPYLILSLILFFSLFLAYRRRADRVLTQVWFSLLFVMAGGLGMLFSFMWFGSEHWVCHANLNLAWAFPLHLVLAVLIWIPKAVRVVRIYCIALAILDALFLLTFPFWKQAIPIEGLLLALSVASGLVRFSRFEQLLQPKPQDQAN